MLRQWTNNFMVNEAVFIMLLQLRRRFITELKAAGRQGDSLFGGQSTTSRCPLAGNAALLSSLSECARARKAADADLVSQLLVCVPFVAESAWLGFPLRSSLIYPCLLNSAF